MIECITKYLAGASFLDLLFVRMTMQFYLADHFTFILRLFRNPPGS